MATFVGNSNAEIQQGIILGMGNPLLDISSEVGDELLSKYDVKLNNAILAEEKHIPIYAELESNFQVDYIAGGATQNSIRVANWMLGVPHATSFMGCIGNDEHGKTLTEAAEKDGVQTHYMISQEQPTGTCAVLIKGGERSLVANLAAANFFTPDHMETDKAKELLNSSKIVYIAGFFLTVSLDTILSVGNHCVDNNKIFCMNLSAPFIVQFFGDQLAAAMMYCDFVFGNESEAEAFGESKEWGKDIPTIAKKISALPKASGTHPRVVVITQGSTSTVVAVGGKVLEFPVEPLSSDQLVDTNGAGDAFVGGFLSQLAKGKALEECVAAGHWASRVIIQRSGCTFPEVCEYSA
eukprot:CAMPEP_0117760686 /NCGR_PEP_ID=MMETSP0947-20121206/16788_1 /TAXON_ID=44440 /ORGANISM="Chattonella subsalsa, Strain CCMP2191" /LENGTH=351 /DNA_ID=CAMNT_0005581445 /DNA_START=43 /DNA_END=1098 /DNA_ORIENTATION=-